MTGLISRCREELRQRRHHQAFRIAGDGGTELGERLARLLAEIPAAEPEEPDRPLDERALADAATNLWRAQRKLAQRGEGGPQARQASRYLRTCTEALGAAGLVVQDHDGDPFHPGRSLEALAFADDPALTEETVVQTVRPTVYLGERRIQMGQVIVGSPHERNDHA